MLKVITKTYPLRAFTDGKHVIVTRGENPTLGFPLGVCYWELNFCLLGWKDEYTKTHPFDWLNQKPKFHD